MRQLVLASGGQFALQNVPMPPVPAEGEALVRVAWVGVSGTEMMAVHQRLPGCQCPRVLGMHVAGKVVQVGPNHDESSHFDGDGKWSLKVGSHVVIDPYFESLPPVPLPSCERNLEVMGVSRDGGMQDYLLVPCDHVHAVASVYSRFHIPSDVLAMIAPLALGIHAARRGSLKPGEVVFVLGQGVLALALCLYARALGCPVVLLCAAGSGVHRGDDHSEMLDTAGVQRIPIEEYRGADDVLAATLQVPPYRLADVVIDTTGEEPTMKEALGLVAYKGRLVYAGFFTGQVAVPSVLLHGRELSILGARHPEPEDYKEAILFVETEKITASALHSIPTHRCEVEEFPASCFEWGKPAAKFVYGHVRLGDVA